MQQYLFNASCIWALGLMVYYALLRKETFHTFNRLYLTGILLAGVCIPLISFQSSISLSTVAAPVVYKTPYVYLEGSAAINKQITVPQQSATTFDTSSILWIIYLVGVFVSLAILIKDVWNIIRLCRNATITSEHNYTLVETKKDTMPFSVFGYIFISCKQNYTTQELSLIIAHELRHIQLKHSIDLMTSELMKLVFWFHPFVYLYKKSLVMVHEYQADKIEYDSTSSYSRFLVEQAMLPTAPILSHSFAHSPLKNRIVMLTRKSAKTAPAKMLVVLPLALVSVLAFSNCKNNAVSLAVTKPEKNGDIGTYKGNTIKLEIRKPDTVFVHDSGRDEPKTIIHEWADRPLTINGKTIHTIFSQAYHDDIDIDTEPVFPEQWETFGDYLFANLKTDFEKLQDGDYNMIFANIVIDEKGEIAFYDYGGIQQIGIPVDESYHAQHLDDKVHRLMNDAPHYTPATINGKPVACRIYGAWGSGMNINKHGTHVKVQNHKAILERSSQS